jgi:choline dehydrogenase
VIPGEAVEDDESLRAYVRAHARTVYHPVGTCAMGTGPMAVTDPRLRVHGLQGLRVVDASIMPAIISGNTNAPAIMIAEKAADMIVQDRRIVKDQVAGHSDTGAQPAHHHHQREETT